MTSENPIDESIEQPVLFSEQDLADLKELGVTDGEAPQFHTILEVWREVLKPAKEEGKKKVTPQWANKMIQSYTELKFSDMDTLRDLYFAKLDDLLEILKAEIATDEECLTYSTPAEDVEENGGHYKALLTDWQLRFLDWELAWGCTDPDAAVQLAAISEVHKMFFGELGLVAFLENIKFEFSDQDQAELGATLEARRVEVLGE